jgi:uncharacterized protein (TIGR00251 family)
LTLARDGVRVAIHLTPRAKADRIIAVVAAAGGRLVLKASVSEPPEDGRANEALLRLLARRWRLSRRDLSIAAGAASRQKTVHVLGEPQRLLAQLGGLIAELSGS